MPATTPPAIAEILYSFKLGGSERLGALLARQFRERGYRVLAASMYDARGPVGDEIAETGIRALGYDYTGRPRWRRWRMPAELTQLFRSENVVAAHLHHGLSAMRAAQAAKRAGVARVVLTEHSTQPLRDLAWYHKATRKALRHVDAVTGVNEEIERYFVDSMGVPASAVTMIPNAVEPQLLEVERDPSARIEAGIGNQFVFAFLGRLHPDKDVGTLLRAFALLVRRHPDALLLVVGDGEERGKLEALCSELALDRHVRFWGASREVVRLFRLADAFVMSSVNEGLPMALLEAMSAGLPCVATAVGGIPTVLATSDGTLVPPRDPDALAAAMSPLASDRELALRLGAAGRAAIKQRFSVDAIVDRYLHIFGLPLRWPAEAST